MWFKDEDDARLKAREKAIRDREELVAERESKIEHQLELARANRDHDETLASIARQDAKLADDHKRRVADLEKEVTQIEADHEHRLALLKAEEQRVSDAIAAKEASNAKELALWPARVEAIVEANEAILKAKDEVIETLKAQLSSLTEKLIAKLPTINVDDITIVPQASKGENKQEKKQ